MDATARVRAKGSRLTVVVVGSTPADDGAVRRLADENGVTGAVHLLHHVSDTALVRLYRRADALVYLSIYEGFGLPIVEAMAAGTPVIAGDRSAVPEVVGKAGLLVDPDSAAEVADAISRLIQTPKLRERLAKMGLERVATHFSWRLVAEQTAAAYHLAVR